MKQPEDSRTIELNLASEEAAKRGRGRPAKPDALTPAERAKRYRDSKRKAGVPRTSQEAKFQMDYTRPTWDDHNEYMETERARVAMIEGELAASKARIAGLETEQALLIDKCHDERKAYDLAMAELERVQSTVSKTGKLASQVLELEAAKAQLIQEKITITTQAAALVDKVRELEGKLKKRDASRKKVTDTDLIAALMPGEEKSDASRKKNR